MYILLLFLLIHSVYSIELFGKLNIRQHESVSDNEFFYISYIFNKTYIDFIQVLGLNPDDMLKFDCIIYKYNGVCDNGLFPHLLDWYNKSACSIHIKNNVFDEYTIKYIRGRQILESLIYKNKIPKTMRDGLINTVILRNPLCVPNSQPDELSIILVLQLRAFINRQNATSYIRCMENNRTDCNNNIVKYRYIMNENDNYKRKNLYYLLMFLNLIIFILIIIIIIIVYYIKINIIENHINILHNRFIC